MARRRRFERRGRPRKASARRRETTAAGRAGAPDRGTAELRSRKRRATMREDLEISPIGVLFGRGHLDAQQYDTLGMVAEWLRRLALSLGPRRDGGVAGLWQAISGAAIRTPRGVPDAVGPAADRARRRLGQMLRRLDGSRDLVTQLAENRTPPLVLRVVEGETTAADLIELERLRQALDGLAGKRGRALARVAE